MARSSAVAPIQPSERAAKRERRPPVVGDRADVPERASDDEAANAARDVAAISRSYTPPIELATAAVRRRPRNASRCDHLHADEVKRSLGADGPRRTNPVTPPLGSSSTPPYLSGSRLGTSASVTSAPDSLRCASASAAEVDVGQRVAVDDEERSRRRRSARPGAARRRCRAPSDAPTSSARARRGRCRRRRPR